MCSEVYKYIVVRVDVGNQSFWLIQEEMNETPMYWCDWSNLKSLKIKRGRMKGEPNDRN